MRGRGGAHGVGYDLCHHGWQTYASHSSEGRRSSNLILLTIVNCCCRILRIVVYNCGVLMTSVERRDRLRAQGRVVYEDQT